MMMTSSASSQDIVDPSTTRAAQRKARLMQIEYQQQLEDMEALRMSEEQAYTLMQSFSDVKVEFCDLDGLQWSGSALRKRAVSVSRPDPSPGVLAQCLNENPSRRARAHTLFCPSSPSLSSASSSQTSSYFPSADTPLHNAKRRGNEALTILHNVDFAPSFDERTVRAVVSPVKAVLELQKHGAPSGRDLDSRPPAKQRRRSRSPVKGAFNKLETPTPIPEKQPGSDNMPTIAVVPVEKSPAMPVPAYTGGAPMERIESNSKRRSLTRTYSQTDITFGVSPTVATEVMRGRERLRGSRDASRLPKPLEDPIMIGEDEEVLESDLIGVGPIRLSPPKPAREPGQRIKGFAAQLMAPSPVSGRLFPDSVEDPLMTPTPERFSSGFEYPHTPATPVPNQSRQTCADFTLLKRKRQSSESQHDSVNQKP
ncbi:hypothetical protein C8R42DRAFT_658035 [Lentinula raphanica]|nr:hypothetical protein C8R42DRAFT_658035 [Lentinula raphanica]